MNIKQIKEKLGNKFEVNTIKNDLIEIKRKETRFLVRGERIVNIEHSEDLTYIKTKNTFTGLENTTCIGKHGVYD